MSSAIFQAPSGELKTSILHKLLSSAQLQLLAKGEKQDEHEADDISSGDVEDDSSTLNTVHFVGLSPDFAAVLRKLYRAAVHEESSISVDRRQRRQAQGAVDAEILNIEKEGNGTTVTLDFLLEQDGNLVPMETALANLQQLSEDEMEALLQVPVLDVERDATNNSVVSLDFSVSEDQQQVPADTALNTLQTLTNQQMSVIIKYPCVSFSVLKLDISSALNPFRGLALVYREALASRKKRSVPADDVILHVRQHRDARSRRQAENGVAAEVTEVTRNGTDPRVTNVTFYVMKDGTPVPASEASVTINKFSPNAISAIIAYPVVSSYVRPVYAVSPTQPGEFDDGAGVLFVVAIVLPSILLLLLMVVLSVFLLRACRPPPPASPADVVPTKYQRGESLDDYNLHVDVERGEIVDLTPHPTPDPNFRRPSKSKSKSSRKSDITTFAPTKEDTLDSKRHMIDKWLQGDHARPRGSVESVESMARSDTFLYSKQSASRSSREAGSKEEKKRKQRARSRHLEVPQEPYKEYLQALRLPESDIDGRDGEHGDHDRSTESFAMEERNVDGEQLQDSERSRSPPAGKQDSPPPLPRAKPRTSFVGKLRESIRKRKRSTTPEYNSMTQSTLVSALADSAQTLPGSHDTTSVDLEESRDEDTHHTDASDEFTVVVPMSRGGSRDRLGSSSTCASPVNAEQRQTDVQGDGGGGAQSRLNLDPSAPTKRTPSKSNLKKSRPGPPATLDSSVQTADSFKDPAGDDCGLLLDARAVKSQEELSKEGYSATATRTMQTQTSFASNSDVSTDSGVTVTSAKKKSVAVGRNTVNVRTQTPKEEKRTKAKR
nr:hypothetical protein BaRGS_016293 [Batillaria attramentaria]